MLNSNCVVKKKGNAIQFEALPGKNAIGCKEYVDKDFRKVINEKLYLNGLLKKVVLKKNQQASTASCGC